MGPEKLKYFQGMERDKMVVVVLSQISGANPLFCGVKHSSEISYDPWMSPPLAVMVLSREGLNLEAAKFPCYTPKPTTNPIAFVLDPSYKKFK